MKQEVLVDNHTLSDVRNRIIVDHFQNNLMSLDQIISSHLDGGFVQEENTIYIKLTDFKRSDEISEESNYTTVGDSINNGYRDYLDTFVKEIFIKTLKEEHIEEGYYSESYKIISENVLENALATKNWLNEIYLEYFQDDQILTGIINLIREFDYEVIYPQGQTIALACLSHRNNFIKELAIRAYEKWANAESLSILKSVRTNVQWLDEYMDEVINDIEVECHTT